MSTSISSSTPEPDRPESGRGKHRLEDRNDERLDDDAMPQRRRWWPIVAIIAIALVLLQLAIFAFRNDSDEPADTDAASEAPVGESVVPSEGGASAGAPEDEPDEQTPVPTDGGYVDPEGEQEVQYEAAPGQFQGIEGMALNVGGDIAAVDPVQLTEAGALIPPSDVSRLGWYSASAVPGAEGAAGSSVITGHINYQGQGTGYAARFANMAVGEEFDVLIDGTPRTFRVTQAPYRLPKGSDFPPEVNDATGPNRLVLITCGGQFVGGALGYADNIITIAEPVAPPAPPAV
ncbi:class F sortase [Corynebacterium afermentans]|uniref:class F sortase n=1 Tax=Corynebacterium afermentans TaxID=38286 RepID=UPI001E3DDD04|nr:class F sortase [Corynebacterium afermentans]WJY59504.1 Sortase family protein [Corynebacterium afermentans subsp. lipophilum]